MPASQPENEAGPIGGRRPLCRCVVLAAGAAPRQLIDGLRQRDADVCVVRHEATVMLELAHGARVVVVVEPETVGRFNELIDAIRRYHPRAVCWRYESDGRGRATLAPCHGTHVVPRAPEVSPPTEVRRPAARPEWAGGDRDAVARELDESAARSHAPALPPPPAATTPTVKIKPGGNGSTAGASALTPAEKRAPDAAHAAPPATPEPADSLASDLVAEPLVTREELDMLLGPLPDEADGDRRGGWDPSLEGRPEP